MVAKNPVKRAVTIDGITSYIPDDKAEQLTFYKTYPYSTEKEVELVDTIETYARKIVRSMNFVWHVVTGQSKARVYANSKGLLATCEQYAKKSLKESNPQGLEERTKRGGRMTILQRLKIRLMVMARKHKPDSYERFKSISEEIFDDTKDTEIQTELDRLESKPNGIGKLLKGVWKDYQKEVEEDKMFEKWGKARGNPQDEALEERTKVRRLFNPTPVISANGAKHAGKFGDRGYDMLAKWAKVYPTGNYNAALDLADRIAALEAKPRLAHLAEALQYEQSAIQFNLSSGLDMLRSLAKGIDPTETKEFTEPPRRGGGVMYITRAKEIVG